ncbi:MAG: glycosyltransferase 87 family protein [Acidobacteriota bacterium]
MTRPLPHWRALLADWRAQAAALLAVVALLLLTLVEAEASAQRPIGNDFLAYLTASRALLAGSDPYLTSSHFSYVYPLLLALLLIPLALLPTWLAVGLWYAINVAAMVAASLLAIRLALPPTPGAAEAGVGVRRLIVPLCLVFFLMFGVIQNNLRNGQVNFVIALLCVLFYRSFLAGRTAAAGLFLALAIALKVAPVFLLLALLRRARWRAFALTLILAAALCLLPAVLAGGRILDLYHGYFGSVLFPTKGTAISWTGTFFTLHGFLAYLWPQAEGIALQLLATVAVIGAALLLDRQARVEVVPANGFWVLAVYLCAMLLLTPWSQKHHLALLVPVVAVVTAGSLLDTLHLSACQRTAAAAFLTFFYLGKLVPTGPFFFLAVVAIGTLVALVIRANSEAPPRWPVA